MSNFIKIKYDYIDLDKVCRFEIFNNGLELNLSGYLKSYTRDDDGYDNLENKLLSLYKEKTDENG
jgi:hypothetical protein